jgi:hypothetical protein
MYQNILERFKKLTLPTITAMKTYWEKVPPRFRKVLKVAGITLGLLFFLLIIFSVVAGISKKRTTVVKNVVPSMVPRVATSSPEEKILNPSRYATDSAILKIEEDLKSVEKELNDLEINEVNLLPPRLDFEINFEK